MQLGQVFPEQYQSLLADKVAAMQTLFHPFGVDTVDVFPSPTEHFRLRAEFRIWHEGDDLFHIMFDPATKQKQRIDYFPIACKTIADFMPRLLAELRNRPLLRNRLYQIDYLATLSGQLVVSLIYKKPIPPEWQAEAAALKAFFAEFQTVHFIGRARKQKILVEQDYVIETLQVGEKSLQYKQIENSFTQPNGTVNQSMLNWARSVSTELSGDLLELYCGNGNFSLALADQFHHVVATEIARSSIQCAQHNIALNHIDNVQVMQMSAEDVSTALLTGHHLKGLDLSALNLNTILVDPPRAGLDADTTALVSRFTDILYISCNPATLATNLATLCHTHQIQRFALFDQFPYTHHIECGVWLKKITP